MMLSLLNNKYLPLLKPKVLLLMMTTAWVGMYLSPEPWPSLERFCGISLGIFLLCGSGAILNHIFETDRDRLMARTKHRPLVKKTISIQEAILFFIAVFGIGTVLALYYANFRTWLYCTLGALGYGVFYTLVLKKLTPQNIVIGGFYGALPPLLGWASLSADSSLAYPWLLVLIIFVWTPPHFWALSLERIEDYKKLDYPTLPVTHGDFYTIFSINLYNLLLFPVCLLPYLSGMLTAFYAFASLILNAAYLVVNIRLFSRKKKAYGASFWFSIGYLYFLFLCMILDKSFF